MAEAEALQCPKCQSTMTSRLEVDGLQHTVHARCEKCGFELDLSDEAASALKGADWAAIGLTGAACLALMGLTSTLDQYDKMLGNFASELPWFTTVTLRLQLPVVFLVVSGLLAVVGTMRRAKKLRGGLPLMWIGCALALIGALACGASLYLPLYEVAGQVVAE